MIHVEGRLKKVTPRVIPQSSKEDKCWNFIAKNSVDLMKAIVKTDLKVKSQQLLHVKNI